MKCKLSSCQRNLNDEQIKMQLEFCSHRCLGKQRLIDESKRQRATVLDDKGQDRRGYGEIF